MAQEAEALREKRARLIKAEAELDAAEQLRQAAEVIMQNPAGLELRRTQEVERFSEAVTPGTIQVPNDGQPIILLGDCQTIGGYPKLAHVITVDLSLAAQLRPNDRVRFREVSMLRAHKLFLRQEDDLDRFRIGLSLRLT